MHSDKTKVHRLELWSVEVKMRLPIATGKIERAFKD